ncbi:MAG: cation-translocating P-type ATPase, partial [Fimbriimonas ginsengisoli]|nr:cation-translocating P-type ATPase [Fimbriimonas ginsengisoli]
MLGGLQAWLTGLCGVSMAVAWALNLNWLAVASVVLGGAYALEAAWKSLRHRSLGVNFLMVFAAVGAVVVKRPIEAAALLFLFSLSGTLEAYTMAKTRRAIEGMVKLRPERCLRIRGAEEELVAVEELELGDHVRLPPHESIPTDGVVISGSSSVDQASMTGESRPVSRTAGDALLGGTINLQGMLVMEVRARVADSTLSRIVELVQDAQENKASGERISTWFGERYTWFVLAAFALSWGIRLALGQAQNEALYASLVLLVALSPCALVISTPATTLSALAYAARRG